MSRTRLLGITAAGLMWALAASPAAALCSTTAQSLQCTEGTIPLTNVNSTCNLYRDLKVKVVFTQGSETRSTYAFWDGGNALKYRMMFPSSGSWTLNTFCEGGCGCASGHTLTNQPLSVGTPPMIVSSIIYPHINDGLDNPNRLLSGSFGDNTLFWLGDTAWAGPLKSTRAAWTNYLNNRLSRGFSVIQVALPVDWMDTAGSQPRDALDPGVAGDVRRVPFETFPAGCSSTSPLPNLCSRWVPAFWQEWERRIQEANDAGFVVVVVGLMEGVIERKGGTWCAPTLVDSEIYARNIAARLAGSPVILSPGFDRYSGSNQCGERTETVGQRIRAIGDVIDRAVPHVLVANHWAGRTPGSEILGLQDEPWLDFQLFQSGQAGYEATVSAQLETLLRRARELPLCVWNRQCPGQPTPTATTIMPGVNGEAIYDGGTHAQLGSANYNAYSVRRTAYFSLLSGAAGYTYGSVGLFAWTDPATGMGRVSNTHMQHLENLFTTGNVYWSSLQPHPEVIANQTSGSETVRMVLAHTADKSNLVAYLPNNAEIQINYATLGTLSKNGRWYNPRNGTWADSRYGQGTLVSGSTYKFCRPCGTPSCPLNGAPARPACPADPDWVLVIP
ncbi:MAG TPA: DUF4038 domain-containing protein [Thermoanaerobaculia bacterium]